MNTNNTYDFTKKTAGDITIELVRLIECTSQTRITFKTTEEVADKLIAGFYSKYLSITESNYRSITELNHGNIFGIKTYVAEAKWKEDLPIIYNKPELGWFTFKGVDARSQWAIVDLAKYEICKRKEPILIKMNESIVHIVRRELPGYSVKLVVDGGGSSNLYKVSQNLDEGVLSFNFEHTRGNGLIKAIIGKFVNGTMRGRNISVCTSDVEYIKNYFDDTGFDVKAYQIGESEVSAVDIHPKGKKDWIYYRMIVTTDNITTDLYDYKTKIKILNEIDSPLVFNKDCPGKPASAYGAARNVRYEEPLPAKEAAKIACNLRMKISELNDIIKLAAEKSDYQVAIDVKHYPEAVIKAFKDAGYDFFIRDGKTYIAW